ncbi:PaaI family thioesterase [Allosphingosinicella flava]|uniref:PaaI family thioesterase n=1 Tax=Allosphingosinicella flava TaxID=2771430 RepID=A0A7T2LLA8_9SPHN|nr:PaaI family thioesterase [Sphingosinicella flava]QPQ54173.1 PaaI family thioesterase [Sphingosinicella flava]
MGATRYGVATPEEAAGMSGLEMIEALAAGKLPAPPIAQPMRMAVTEVEKGRVVFTGTPDETLLNPLGGVHGGFALTLIDSATGCAVHTMLDAGVGYATVETKANFTRPIRADCGTVFCEGRVVSMGRQIATAEAYLRDGEGRVLAHGTSTLIILSGR